MTTWMDTQQTVCAIGAREQQALKCGLLFVRPGTDRIVTLRSRDGETLTVSLPPEALELRHDAWARDIVLEVAHGEAEPE